MKRFGLSLVVLLGIGSAWAGSIAGVTSIGALNPNYSVNWSQFGPGGTMWSGPQTWCCIGIVVVTPKKSHTWGPLYQGMDWNGNFLPGEPLLWNYGASGETGIDFGIGMSGNYLGYPVNGGGLQIQADFFGPFVATVSAYDSWGNLLGTFSELGNSNSNGDGSAIFIGILDTVKEIDFLDFNVVGSDGGDSMAIGTLYLAGHTATPEPGSLLLFGSGVLGLASMLRRKVKL